VNAQYVNNDPTSKGDGDDPFVGTTYTYTVTKGDLASTVAWSVYLDTDLEAGDLVTPGATTYTISDASVVNPQITWHAQGTYYLTYTETLNGCDTRRGLKVVVTENSFYLELADDIPNVCNGLEGDVLDWTTYKTKTNVPSSLIYTVDIEKDGAFAVDAWEFDGELVKTKADLSFVSITSNDTDATIILTGDTFTVRGAKVDKLILTVVVNSKVTTTDDVRLNVTNGKARTGAIVTDDNTTKGVDRFQVNSLKGLPAATNISFN